MYSESHFARFWGFLKKLLYIVHLQLYGLGTIQVLLLKVSTEYYAFYVILICQILYSHLVFVMKHTRLTFS